MIASFKDPGTEDIFDGKMTDAALATLTFGFHAYAARVMDRLNAASSFRSLPSPGLQVEACEAGDEPSGDVRGDVGGSDRHFIRIPDQHRIRFRWTEVGAEEVEIVDGRESSRSRIRVAPARASHSRTHDPPMRRLPGRRRPAHPGFVFYVEFLHPETITQREVAARLRISYPRLNEIINEKRRVTPETALRLARFTNTDPERWLDLQQIRDLWDAIHSEAAADVDEIEPITTRRRRGRDNRRRAGNS